MDFDDTPAEAAFRREARAWLDANAPHHLKDELEMAGFGSGTARPEETLAAARAWQKRKADAGWACLQWPKAFGGRDASAAERAIWDQEEGVFGRLSFLFLLGHGMCGPTLMAFASEDEQRARLPPIVSGEDIWCQLFSEPSGGSDLASLRTRAERDGEAWVVNGQKIWTSGAHVADWGLLLARTDPTVPKHKGLTMFYVDMRAPGVEVRPIRQATGHAEFNEVFFTDVRIPDSQRLGPPGAGWTVSLTTLMNERFSIGASAIDTGFSDLLSFCQDAGSLDDRNVRSRLADWATRDSGLRYTALRAVSALSRGERPGPENSIGKLVAASMMQDIAAFALELQGADGIVTDPARAAAMGRFQALLIRAQGSRIEGGTDEIMRNIIAERVLGLPGEVRFDKDIPYNQLQAAARP